MPHIEAHINEGAIQFLTRWLPSSAFDAIERAVGILVIDMERYIKERTYPDSGLHRRTGNLFRSIRAQRVKREGRSVIGRVLAGQRLAYARIQEFGGTITPVSAQYLTIPIGDALTNAGVARFDAHGAEDAGYKTFVANHIIFGKKPGQKKAVPLFLLRKQVEIPERRYMRNAMDAFQERIVRDIAQAVRVEVRKIHRS
jgi:hypothetical protein